MPAHAALRLHDFCQRISALPGSTGHGEADPAVVWRIGNCMDHVPRIFPGSPVARIRVCGRGRAKLVNKGASTTAYRSARVELPGPADRSRRSMEAARHGKSHAAHPGLARSNDRSALSPVIDDEPIAAGVVCAALPRKKPLSTFCSVQSRVDARAGRLSLPPRTLGSYSSAVALLVGGLRRIRAAMHGVRMVQLASGIFVAARCRDRNIGCRDSADTWSPAAVGDAGGNELVPPPGRLESHLPEYLGDPVALGCSALDLSHHIHSVLRGQRLVPARLVRGHARGCAGRHGMDACRPQPHA